MAQEIQYNISADASKATQTLGELKQEFDSLKETLDNVEKGSTQFNNTLVKLGELKGEIEGVERVIDQLNPEKTFENVARSLSGVAGGFQSVAAATQLFGIENDAVLQSLQKINALMAVTAGFQQFAESLPALKAINAQFTFMSGSGIKGVITALGTLRGAIIATGIGAFVVALGLVVAYWDDIKEGISGVSSEQRSLVKLQQESVQAADDALDAISRTENILKLQGKTEGEILQMKKQATEEAIRERETRLKTTIEQTRAQAEIAQRNKDILQGLIRFITLPITALLAGIDLIGKAFNQNFNLEEQFSGGLAGLLFDPKAVGEEGDKTVKELEEQLETLRNTSAGYDLKLLEDKKSANKLTQTQAEDNAKKLLEIEKRLRDQVELLDKSEFDKRRILAQREFDETTKELNKTSQAYLDAQTILNNTLSLIASDQASKVATSVTDILNTINSVYGDNLERLINSNLEGVVVVTQNAEGKLDSFTNDAIGRTNFKFQQEIDSLVKLQATTLQKIEETRQAIQTGPDYPQREADLLNLANLELSIATQTGESIVNLRKIQAGEIKQIEETTVKSGKELDETVLQTKIDIASRTLGAIGGFLKEGSVAGKSFAVAEATTNTYSAANAAFKSAASSPITTFFPAYPAIQAGLAVAFGLANVKKILATNPTKGGGGSGLSTSGIGRGSISPSQQIVTPPRFGRTQADVTQTILSPTDRGLLRTPIKAIVTEVDITRVQNRVKEIQRSSSF